MKTSAKFAALYFGTSIICIIVLYIVFPNVYPGDSFTIVWLYLLNLFIGVASFPVFYLLLKEINFSKKANYVLSYFVAGLLVANLVPLASEHVFYTGKIFLAMFKHTSMQSAATIEFILPFFSFLITYFAFRKSALWQSHFADTNLKL